ncbi:MAG TPA: MauE/DoxX family redox-associated membrane protein, partial [Nocardioides sp.]|nr:MauE/DoxX family redox-associated membrane protein [Nocardioides sp.]
GAAVVSALLFAAFIIGIASVWARGIEIDCGCFGGGGYDPDATSKYPWEIARDVVLLALSLFLVWLPRSRWALDSVLFRSTPAEADEPAETLEGT